jgi:hypothetical protein
VFEELTGWMKFPAKINGWAERRPAPWLHELELHEVPLWLSFNTGLLDGHSSRLHLAA